MLFITGNKNKLAEVQVFFPHIQQHELDLPEIQSLDAEEIIYHKIGEARKHIKEPFIVEDTSLHCTALGGFPWPLIKRVTKHEWPNGLRRMLADYESKKAWSQCTLWYRDGDQIHILIGTCPWQIVPPQGETNFSRDSVFLPKGSKKTFAQMTKEQKSDYSHRAKACIKLQEILASNQKTQQKDPKDPKKHKETKK